MKNAFHSLKKKTILLSLKTMLKRPRLSRLYHVIADNSPSSFLLFIYLFRFFVMWAIFKGLVEFVIILLQFYV